MAGSKSNVFEINLLKAVTGQSPAGPFGSTVITPWMALYTALPTESSAGTEAAYGGYARVDSSGSWAAPSGGSVTTNQVVAFPAKIDTGTVTIVGWALMSGNTPGGPAGHGAGFAGEIIYYSDLRDAGGAPVSKVLGMGDILEFAAGNITITED